MDKLELEAIIVDTKTFHCTLGYVWEVDTKKNASMWADEAAIDLKKAYVKGYGL